MSDAQLRSVQDSNTGFLLEFSVLTSWFLRPIISSIDSSVVFTCLTIAGTVMNGKMVESPKSFQVACTVLTQIIAAVASNQYGGQSIKVSHLGKYLRKSYNKFYQKYIDKGYKEEESKDLATDRMMDELNFGDSTILPFITVPLSSMFPISTRQQLNIPFCTK